MAVASYTGFPGCSTYQSPWLDDPKRTFLVKHKRHQNVTLKRHVSLPPSRIQRTGLSQGVFTSSGLRHSQRKCRPTDHPERIHESVTIFKRPTEVGEMVGGIYSIPKVSQTPKGETRKSVRSIVTQPKGNTIYA